jgi:fatty acid-binding protein DegV
MHAHAGESAERVSAGLRAKLSTVPTIFEELEAGPVLGTHAGQGAVGVFVIPGGST